VKNIQSVAYDNYDDFQHFNFIFGGGGELPNFEKRIENFSSHFHLDFREGIFLPAFGIFHSLMLNPYLRCWHQQLGKKNEAFNF
jgi:hypothetical protein